MKILLTPKHTETCLEVQFALSEFQELLLRTGKNEEASNVDKIEESFSKFCLSNFEFHPEITDH